MSILASDVFTAVKAILDDDNSGRYSEADDLTPFLNSAINYMVIVLNAAFEQKKASPESLRELTKTAIVTTTGSGSTKKANVTSIMTGLWTIFGIEPDPEITTGPDTLSMTRNRWATRMTLEAWNDAASDPFSASSLQSMPADFIRPGYLGPGHYFSDTDYHILIRPASVFTADKVAVWYLKNPTKVTGGASTIEFPQSVYNFLVEKTLNYLSRQHSPDSKYLAVTDKEITQLVNLING
jgi:hypothetical protein